MYYREFICLVALYYGCKHQEEFFVYRKQKKTFALERNKGGIRKIPVICQKLYYLKTNILLSMQGIKWF